MTLPFMKRLYLVMRTRIFVPLMAAALWTSALAIWAPPDLNAPIERLLSNAQAASKANPGSAYPVYLQGRLHSLAFARGPGSLSVYSKYSDKKPFSFPSHDTVQIQLPQAGKLKPEDLNHLRKSLVLYHRAVTMDGKSPIYALGRAWMHEQAIPYAGDLRSLPWLEAKPLTAKALRAEALASYRRIVRDFLAKDKAIEPAMMGVPDLFASQEAAERIIALLSTSAPKAAELREIARMKSIIKEFEAKPKAITPILVPLDRSATLGSLIDDFADVRFDLDGNGLSEVGAWVTPSAGILVWDPEEKGRITSGRQLFGPAAFWMLFPDGYSALASLDDDANGWLAGSELKGIAVWCDANGNGCSEPGEVLALSRAGVAALRTRPSAKQGGMLMAEEGVRWSDGKVSPTWDWVVQRDERRGR